MRSILSLSLVLALILTLGLSAADLELSKPVPDFELSDVNGKEHKLSDFKGKYVVLEWINFECPFVKKHYNSKNMQTLQKAYTGKDVIWLSICSSAPGKQGHFDNKEVLNRLSKLGAANTAYLVDSEGKVGKAYGAKTTPHMFVIDKEGILIYNGAIDDIRSTDVDDIKEATNYISEILDAALAGKKVEPKATSPYGCSVKYK